MLRTVLGDIEVSSGPILAHEHLQIDLSHNKGSDTVLSVNDEPSIIADLKQTAEIFGLKVVVDLSVHGSGRNPEILRDIAQKTGVGVVCATGFYWDPMPSIVQEYSFEQLRDIMIREIETCVENTEIRCGAIKVGTSKADPDAISEKLFCAAAGAAVATGAAIVTHTSTPEQAGWHLDVFAAAGVNLSRVLISHMHHFREFEDFAAIGARGCFMGIDQIGFRKGPGDERIADITAQAVKHGLGNRLILSSDIARKSRLVSNGGDGYATTFSKFLPLLKQRNISTVQIDQMMCANPREIFSISK